MGPIRKNIQDFSPGLIYARYFAVLDLLGRGYIKTVLMKLINNENSSLPWANTLA